MVETERSYGCHGVSNEAGPRLALRLSNHLQPERFGDEAG